MVRRGSSVRVRSAAWEECPAHRGTISELWEDQPRVLGTEANQFFGRYQKGARDFARGNPESIKALYSQADDVTLANPFGPAVRGWTEVSKALDFASSRFSDGDVEDFELIAVYDGGDLITVLASEKWHAKVGDRSEVEGFELRVTTTLRREGGELKMVHRHADPITTPDVDGPLRRG